MLKKALSNSSLPHYHHPNSNGSLNSLVSSRWKSRLCLGFMLVICLSFGVILIAWNMICSLDTGSPAAMNNEYQFIGDSRRINRNSSSSGGDHTNLNDNSFSNLHVVEIHYEVLCPDSRHFILKQFNPTFNKLRNFIKPVFVPYGKATTQISPSGDITFDCQHGNEECLGNMIHACAIKYVRDEDELVSYIGCMINNNRKPESVAAKCASGLGIDLAPIAKCWRSNEGKMELKRYGHMTQSLNPPVSFIPTIVIDQSQQGQAKILQNSLRFICRSVLSKEELQEAGALCDNE